MDKSANSSNSSADTPMSAEHDLLYSLLDPEWRYPWDPTAPESEAYFRAIEADWDEAALAETVAAGWQQLSCQLDQHWAEAMAPVAALVSRLQQQFQGRMPKDLLHQVATAATQLTKSGQPLVNQLVDCAQAVLLDWQAEDLAVLARPMAFSLRDGRGEIIDLQMRALPQAEWSALSALEQARLSLIVASVALEQAATLEA